MIGNLADEGLNSRPRFYQKNSYTYREERSGDADLRSKFNGTPLKNARKARRAAPFL